MMHLLKLACLFVFVAVAGGNVMSVDLGSDSMKIAIVQPGMPMEIVSNLQSKRKTPTCLSFYKGERLFGSDGYALMGRKPEVSLSKFNRLIGRPFDHPRVTELKEQFFPYEITINDTTKTTQFKVEETEYTPEELLAMLLQHAKLLALNHGGKAIKDCVITVPISFTQHERSAIYTAATIADLNILTLIEENTAAALQYGIDRVHETPNTVLYYNMGAEGIQVTIVTYSSYIVKESGKNKTIGQFEVVGKAWDDSVGGFNFDLALAKLLADRFNIVWSSKKGDAAGDVKEFYRPMTRLRLESNKIKEVLSANQEFHFKAEQLHADVDLITKITRSDFEEAAKDLFAKITGPIDAALAMANLTINDIQAVELLGGSVRIPKVKKLLDDYFKGGSAEVGQHLNGDEAMALGAAFRAANLSTAFRVRKVGMSDILSFGVSVKLESLPIEPTSAKSAGLFGSLFGQKEESKDKAVDNSEEWTKQTLLYPTKSTVPGKTKTLAFHYDKDILCKIQMDASSDSHVGNLLAVYNITGIADFAKEASTKGYGTPKVHLSFVLDSSGIVSIVKAEITADPPIPLEPIVSSDQKTATTSETNSTDSSGDSPNSEPAGATDPDAASGKDAKNTKDAKKDSKKKKEDKKDTVLKKPLTITLNPFATYPASWTPASIASSRAKLRALDAIDETRKAREAALNELEAFIYSTRNKVNDDEGGIISAVSTSEQREEVITLANETEDWLYDAGRNAEILDFKTKQDDLKSKAGLIFKRASEMKARPAAVAKARKGIADLLAVIESWEEKLPQVTSEEKSKLIELLNKAEAWINEKEAEQSKLASHETPAFDSSEVTPQLKSAATLFEKLSKKPKPIPEKVTIINSNTTDSNSTTASNNSTSESSDAQDPIEVKIPGNTTEDSQSDGSKPEVPSAEEEL